MTKLPACRNPNNDPPRLGEMIHYTRGDTEFPGIVSEKPKGGTFPATIFRSAGAEVYWLHADGYDPTANPAPQTWHFHHLS